jgi:protein-S-isoprenylcysteine O-methyltransferase Ste14
LRFREAARVVPPASTSPHDPPFHLSSPPVNDRRGNRRRAAAPRFRVFSHARLLRDQQAGRRRAAHPDELASRLEVGCNPYRIHGRRAEAEPGKGAAGLLNKLFLALRALIYAAAFTLFWGWLALAVRAGDRRLGIALPAWTRSGGVVFMVLGGILSLLSAGTFVARGKGTPAPFDAPREFVAAGVYRYVRNPMYIGGWAVLFGFGLFLDSFSVLFLSLAALFLAHLFVVGYEEPKLREKFGAAYQEYCHTVPRWIPRRARARGK